MKLGVFDVIPRGSLDSLTAEDLRLLLNGMGDISTQSLIGYTSFNDESSTYLFIAASVVCCLVTLKYADLFLAILE